MSMKMADGAQGGVCLVARDQPQVWSVESAHVHGTNMVSGKVIAKKKRTLTIGAYLPPYTL